MAGRAKLRQKSLWLQIVGWACVVVGVAGLALPILPGLPILLAGLVTLSTQHRWARALLLWVKKRFRKRLADVHRCAR
jgi:uncharacterized membrane protein YbaN (DUF454 family)